MIELSINVPEVREFIKEIVEVPGSESSHVKYNFRAIILSFKNLTEMDMRGVEVIT